MTPYCALGDVQALIKNWTIDDSSNVAATAVTDDIIPEVSQKIDERLGKYYVTPITGSNALMTVKRIARWWAAAEVASRIYIGEAPSEVVNDYNMCSI